ncbi:MAG: tyrosine--tRNA ligase [Actinomycetota bacterium]|nr:tyrosine--tRNA ligase [Actinomycetota bacterium]MDQ2957360.1 tyrosine--tRNA ligase [Actinomycetota bacterium]
MTDEAERPQLIVESLPPDLRDGYRVLAAGAAQILPKDGLAERLLAAKQEGRPLRVKLGIDPSGTSLTLGHAVVLRKLRQFQDLGHTAVLVVGGFTGQVGDPSGKTATRSAQSAEQVVANASGYFEQLMRILDPDRTEVRNNADWLAGLGLADLLGYTRQLTVAQLLERDDFARRFASNTPITLSEFFYPLLQGIDSVEIRADIELGGTDQTFNNLVGRTLQRAEGQPPQAVLTVPLLVGIDGVEKMGKSLDNFVAISEPADQQFGKLMRIPDTVIELYATLCTQLHPDEVAVLAADVVAGGGRANQAKRRVAAEIVSLYHGREAAVAAEERFNAIFRDGAMQNDAPLFQTELSETMHLPALLVAAGLAATTSESRRLIDAGGVKIDGIVVPPRGYDQTGQDLDGRLLSVGKRKVVRVTKVDS